MAHNVISERPDNQVAIGGRTDIIGPAAGFISVEAPPQLTL
jgi:hypothetical protein